MNQESVFRSDQWTVAGKIRNQVTYAIAGESRKEPFPVDLAINGGCGGGGHPL